MKEFCIYFRGLSCSLLTEPSSQTGELRDMSKGAGDVEEGASSPLPGSKGSTLSSDMVTNDSMASLCGENHSASEYEIVKAVLYSSRENVNTVHECFRQVTFFLKTLNLLCICQIEYFLYFYHFKLFIFLGFFSILKCFFFKRLFFSHLDTLML